MKIIGKQNWDQRWTFEEITSTSNVFQAPRTDLEETKMGRIARFSTKVFGIYKWRQMWIMWRS